MRRRQQAPGRPGHGRPPLLWSGRRGINPGSIRETRAYAQTTYGRDLVITGNVAGLTPNLSTFVDLLDYLTPEYFMLNRGYPPQNQGIQDYKLARAFGKPAAMMVDTGTNGGAWVTPYAIMAKNEAGISAYHADMPALVPLYRFIRRHSFLYEDLEDHARTVIVYSYPSHDGRYDYGAAFSGLGSALLNGHVQFDIVNAGDNRWLADALSIDKLAPYNVAFLPGATHLSDAQVATLLAFATVGGTVVTWGDSGVHDELGREVVRPQLAALTTPGTHPLGAGRFIALDGDPGERYHETQDPAVRETLVDLVRKHGDAITQTAAPATVNVVACGRAGGTQLVLHLINYDYTLATDTVTPAGPFRLTVRPPAALLSQANLQLYLLSPQRPAPVLLNYTVQNGLLTVEHPGLAVFDTLIFMPAATAQALVRETREPLAEQMARATGKGYDLAPVESLAAQAAAAAGTGNHLLARQLGAGAQAQLQQITRPRILFNEAHGETGTLDGARALSPEHPDWVDFSQWARLLADQFLIQRNAANPLTDALLADYDVLITASPQLPFAAAELEAIQRFVQRGGGLLVLGDNSQNQTANLLTQTYGITFDSTTAFLPVYATAKKDTPGPNADFCTRNIASHPAVQGVPFMSLNWGSTLTLSGDATPLIFTDANSWLDVNQNEVLDAGEPEGPFVVAGAYESGPARVVALADNALHDASLDGTRNDILMRAVLNWLSGR